MRFAAIADVHGNSAALKAVLADIHRRGVSEIVNLGDVLSGPLDPAGTADILMPLNLPTVLGNHDAWLFDRPEDQMGLWEAWTYPDLTPAHLNWIKGFAPKLSWNGVFLCHATPTDFAENWLDRRGEGSLVPSPRVRIETRLADVSQWRKVPVC